MQPAVILWYLDTVSEDCNVVTYTKSNLRSVFFYYDEKIAWTHLRQMVLNEKNFVETVH